MTDAELAAISERVQRATPGPWYPIVTDDERYQGAVYVGLQAHGKLSEVGLYVDGGRGKKLLVEGAIDDESVVAITCLQFPRLAYQDACDDNALFIAHARDDMPRLLAEVRRLRALLAQQA
ncbi:MULTISPECIES: hypothetical protein [unclassified Deinococcus]|uniref:hypothetical protein n=1 Tax=unclassified Deinococcus TaxID=2623546 RepID=UPI001C30782A|nr:MULTISPECIES: hypothetical protein [unclassified Deinococcus]MDK2011134.1 hypothetical protein [Deinococcus sp. 43]